mmetsp:Transcript_134082/g.237350  ORF Transcript_134082/g.237350 Transcript_134082/m.237350 type:complete len:346 (+) Transcript_134082:51-1088(+)
MQSLSASMHACQLVILLACLSISDSLLRLPMERDRYARKQSFKLRRVRHVLESSSPSALLGGWLGADESVLKSSSDGEMLGNSTESQHLLALTRTDKAQSAVALDGGVGSFLAYSGYFIIIAVLAVCIGVLLKWQLIRRVHYEIQERDRDLIGTDIHIEKIDANIITGRIWIYGLDIDNMKDFTADTIFRADYILVDFDIQRLLMSFFTHIKIEELALSGVHVTVEHTLLNSNVSEMIKFIKDKVEKGQKEKTSEDSQDSPKSVEVTIHRIDVQGIEASTRLSTSKRIVGKRKELHTSTWPIKDIVYEDFHTNKGIQTVIKSILSGVLQKVKDSMTTMACAPCGK